MEMNTQNPDLFDSLPAPWGRIFSFFTRVFVWLCFFSVLYLLRSFFLLVFLTFVFSYIQAHAVHRLERRFPNRTLCVIAAGLLLLGLLIGVGTFIVPRVADQAEHFADNSTGYLKAVDAEVIGLSGAYPFLERALSPESHHVTENDVWNPRTSPSLMLVQQLMGIEIPQDGTGGVKQLAELFRNIAKHLLGIGSAFFLSLLFSFLIVLDLPRLSESVQRLRFTKIGFIYDEVADSILSFGRVLGQALEAQLIIAAVNTFLTAFVIYFLGLSSKLAFLSVIVFLCSFIPVAGVFISSLPICLMVLENSGPASVLVAALAIWVIHLIEAYILNPKIFGNRLHINPVLVLIILTISGKLFHVWGLLLGVPICTYLFGHAIHWRNSAGETEASPVLHT